MKSIGLIFFVFIAILSSCTNKRSDSFKVGVRALPKNLDPRYNEVNVFHYINTHIYLPLFEKDNHGRLSSHFLDLKKTKSLSLNFNSFVFCLKEGVKFSDGTLILVQNLKTTIGLAHQKNVDLPRLVDMKHFGSDGQCLQVKINKKDPGYFHKFVYIDSTLLKEEPSKKNSAPIGFGPYVVTSISENKIVLDANPTFEKIKAFKKIEFIRISTPDEGLKENIQDWNHLWQHLGSSAPIPDKIKKEWRKFEQNLLRSFMIIVNIKDSELRRKVNFCFDKIGYMKELKLQNVNVPGLLPIGVPGGSVSYQKIKESWNFSKDDCRPSANAIEVPFYLFYPSLELQVRYFFETNKNKFPIKVKVVLTSVDEAIKKLFSGDQLMISSLLDSLRPSPIGFFSPFIGPKGLLLEKSPTLEDYVKKGAQSTDNGEIERYFFKAHAVLIETGFVIPLGQVSTTYYYPPFIKEIPYVDPVNGFPSIDKIEVR